MGCPAGPLAANQLPRRADEVVFIGHVSITKCGMVGCRQTFWTTGRISCDGGGEARGTRPNVSPMRTLQRVLMKFRRKSRDTSPLHHTLFWNYASSSGTMATMLALRLLLSFLLPLVSALKFDIQAHPGHESKSKERCVRNFVAKDQLVVVTTTVSGNRGDGQILNMHVSSDIPQQQPHPRLREASSIEH